MPAMAGPEIDWTFAEAPEPDSPSAGAPPPPMPPRLSPRRGRLRWPGRRWLLPLALLLALAVGAYAVVVRVGEQRVRQQLTAEVVYEDAQSLAGAADLALSVWAAPPSGAAVNDPLALWRARRAAEVALGLAAPLPVAALTPAGGEPAVTAVQPDPNTPNCWTVTVVRGYHDSAGNPAQFALDQRYQNLGPGLWQRVAPDTAALATTTVLAGERLSITLPVDDLPYLSDSLFAVDAALVRACADWGAEACGANRLVVVFTAQPNLLLKADAPPPGAAAGRGPYPWAFDLAAHLPEAPTRLYLPSPHVSGVPFDAAARAALTHALTVYGLTALADVANVPVGVGGPLPDPFRDALIARAELRLGLTPPPTSTVTAADYLPVTAVWAANRNAVELEPAVRLTLQFEALQFLEVVLAGQPPTVEADLLRTLRRRPDLRAWLVGALGAADADTALAAWDQSVTEQLSAAGRPVDLDGLLYSCEGETYLQRGGETLALPGPTPWPGQSLSNLAFSGDGRYLARVVQSDRGVVQLEVLDLSAPEPVVVALAATAPEIYLIGWAADQTLVYTVRAGSLTDASVFELRGYDRAAGQSRVLVTGALGPWFLTAGDWLPDHTGLIVNLTTATDNDPLGYQPVLVSLDPAVPPRPLAEHGFPMRLSPDGRTLVYSQVQPNGSDFALAALALVDLATGAERVLVRAADLHAVDSSGVELSNIIPLAWSGDSAWVVALTAGNSAEAQLYLLPADGARPPVQLPRGGSDFAFYMAVANSPDGRYLSYAPYGEANFAPLALLDLTTLQPGDTAAVIQTLTQQATAAAWAPSGHRLAVAGAGGLRIIDLDTGPTRWLDFRNCSIVEWYALPPG